MWLFAHLPHPLEESPVTDENTYTKPEPVRMLGAITTGLTTFFGGITLVAGLQDNKTVALVAGVGMLVTAAVNAAKDEYVRRNVIPAVDAGAYRDASGAMVAGAAAAAPEGAKAVVLAEAAVDPRYVSTAQTMTGGVQVEDSYTSPDSGIKPLSDPEGPA